MQGTQGPRADLPLAYRGSARFPPPVKLLGFCMTVSSRMYLAGSLCLSLHWGQKSVVGNGVATGWREQFRSFGGNTWFCFSVTMSICEVVIQNRLSQVSEFTSSRDRQLSPEAERPPSSEMALLPPVGSRKQIWDLVSFSVPTRL